MVFSYSEYFEKVFVIPLILLIIVIIDLLFLLYRRRPNGKHHVSKFELILQIVGIVVLAFVSITQFRLGIILDNEQSTQTISGDISNISDVRLPSKYYMNGSRVWPKLIEIDGEEYYIMTIGDFELNDQVEIEYLKNSKIVISIFEDSDD